MAKHASKRSFGQITELPSGRFRARYTGPDTALHNAPYTFDAPIDAEAWLTDERRLVQSGNWKPPKVRDAERRAAELERDATKFGPYARAWLTGRHDLRATTRASYETALTKHLLPTFGATPIDEISATDVRAWFATYGDRTPTARAHAYQVLATVMRQAVDDGLIVRTPCRIKAGGKVKVTREPEVLTVAELLALADAMPERHRALTLLCGFGGLRFGEAVALRRRDVNLEGGTVSVAQGATRVRGRKMVGAPKTRAAVRTVAIPDVVVNALKAHMAAQPITDGRNGLIFTGRDGQPLSPTALYGNVARVEKRNGKQYRKAGYGFKAARDAIGRPNLHWHDLRRTAATLGAQSGATVREMQSRLGHTTPAMALHYQSATADRDRAIADRLDKMVDDSAR